MATGTCPIERPGTCGPEKRVGMTPGRSVRTVTRSRITLIHAQRIVGTGARNVEHEPFPNALFVSTPFRGINIFPASFTSAMVNRCQGIVTSAARNFRGLVIVESDHKDPLSKKWSLVGQ